MSDLPFQTEYAKSGRAGCKGCSKLIDKDSLRLAIMMQSRHFDGKAPNWFHFECFWSRAKCTKTDNIHGFDNLRWEDQEKIKSMVTGERAGNNMSSSLITFEDYSVEYAKSNRSTCRGCLNKIDKGIVRISCKEYDSDRAQMYGPQDAWYHVNCFIDKRHELGFTEAMDSSKIPGCSNLSTDDKIELVKKLGKGNGKKRKAEVVNTEKTLKRSKDDIEINLQIQNQLIWKIRDNLKGIVSNEALKGLLQYNDQAIVPGESKLLDCVSDAMAFGALKPCPECNGYLKLSGSNDGYCCTGNISGWTKCQYATLLPLRKHFKVPKEYHDVEFLKSYKYVERQRCFPKRENHAVKDIKEERKILNNIKIGFMGKLGIKQAEATRVIEELGGIISKKKVDPDLSLIISTKGELNKQNSKAKLLKEMKIPVVSEEFIEDVKISENEDLIRIVSKYLISDWDYDINKVSSNPLKGKPETNCMFIKTVPSKVKVSVKGGAAVDPDSGLVDKCHVLQGENKDDIFNVVLGLVDVLKGTNSFYKLQLLEADKGKKWRLFRSWGRVGTSIGGSKLENFSSKQDGIDVFKALYEEKTGNSWDHRENFVKVPNKFYPLDIDYGSEKAEERHLNSLESKSDLPVQIRELIQLVFNIENMKRVMLEFEIDLKKMPLGKLSRKQIENAYKILTELQMMVDSKRTSSQILDASNHFYTLIPHDFGLKKPPLLDNTEIIKSRIEMLDNLLEIEIAYSLMNVEKDVDLDQDIFDVHYKNLKADLKVLNKDSEEFRRIIQYVKNTHGATHTEYDLEVLDIFRLDRHGESKAYKSFKDLNNRMLLWHGSRLTNFVGIISQGLRIAPPEAPMTGYMFGKGIYFADMVSKSANYCMTSKKNPIGLMLLSEVALGNMYELTNSEYIEKLPKGKHSTKGLGRTAPDPSDNFMCDDGAVIPMGKGKTTNALNTSLLYNEYIVYDVAQVNLKYLLKMNFKYRK